MSTHRWSERTFAGRLAERARQAVLELGTPVSYQPRQVMLRQGDDSRYTLLIVSGHAKVIVNADGHDVLLAIRCPGDLVGEMATLTDGTRVADVVAAGPVVARLIKGAELADAMDRHRDLCLAVVRSLVERLAAADRRLVDFVSCPAPVRVCRVIADLIDTCGVRTPGGWQPDFPMSQAEIAALAGVGLSTVEKVLVTMQQRGVLERRYRQIVISDRAELRRSGGLKRRNPY